jgi:hypothetical protein
MTNNGMLEQKNDGCLVHGAVADAWNWNEVISILEKDDSVGMHVEEALQLAERTENRTLERSVGGAE